MEHIDLFSTLCELAGGATPETVQGRSLAALLDGSPPPEDWRDAVFSQIGNMQMIRTEAWKLNVYDGEPGELFDMANDPEAFHNRIADSAYREMADALHHRLKAWEETHQPEG